MTAFELAQRYVGIKEIAGGKSHPLVQWWLSLCFDGNLDMPDETPWCSAFVNGIAWELRLPRSKSARARSWLHVGFPIAGSDARVGDVAIFNRGGSPDHTVIDSPGHVGFFAKHFTDNGGTIMVLGGNQGDAVSIRPFKASDLLGVRRLAEWAA